MISPVLFVAEVSLMQTTVLPLEDNVMDILGKAQRGLHLSNEELADRAGIQLGELQRIKTESMDSSEISASVIEKLAFALQLDAPTLLQLAKGTWYPEQPPVVPGLAMFTTQYGDMTVNANLIWDPDTRSAASFDTGATCTPMLEFIEREKLVLKRIFITHTHADHMGDIDRLSEKTQAPCYGSAIENPLGLLPLHSGDGLTLDHLRIRVLKTSGHTPGGLSYFIQGLSKPVVIVGDAMFAGSMGGAPYAYAEALHNNKAQILSLPDETIVCPGHGPLTTVWQEKKHNPFFPEFK